MSELAIKLIIVKFQEQESMECPLHCAPLHYDCNKDCLYLIEIIKGSNDCYQADTTIICPSQRYRLQNHTTLINFLHKPT